MFKSWGILEAGACDHEPRPPWKGRTQLLHCWVAQEVHIVGLILCPPPTRSCIFCNILVQTMGDTTSFHPRPLYFLLFKSQQLPSRKQNVSSNERKHSKAPLRLYPSVLRKAKSQLALIKYGLKDSFADASLKT